MMGRRRGRLWVSRYLLGGVSNPTAYNGYLIAYFFVKGDGNFPTDYNSKNIHFGKVQQLKQRPVEELYTGSRKRFWDTSLDDTR